MKKPNEQDLKINQLLAAAGIEFSALLVGATKREKWECDQWVIQFRKIGNGAIHLFDYFTGTGHRVKSKNYPYNMRPVAPFAAIVLYGLISDESLAADTFEDFCANCGYDTDSRKALENYLACQEEGAKLRKIFTGAQLSEIRETLQDY